MAVTPASPRSNRQGEARAGVIQAGEQENQLNMAVTGGSHLNLEAHKPWGGGEIKALSVGCLLWGAVLDQ